MALELRLAGALPAGVDQKLLDRALAEVAKLAGTPMGAINLKFVDDQTIQVLNCQYGQSNQATDVLSFSYIENQAAPVQGELGDVAISFETANRQARMAKTDLKTEVTLLLVHGSLHILGYDHQDSDQTKLMDQLQAKIMAALGLEYRNFGWHLSKV